ncbi:hypothetical protein ACQKKK_21575 [Peribacillus sp. NPDC006672]|uniref:hypothetical protein n=1 Tax=Peribacillus sp. NPDC006672 TaxID=3390606 RepID=UPI003D003CA0
MEKLERAGELVLEYPMKSESFDFFNQIISERIHNASIQEYLEIMMVELDRD